MRRIKHVNPENPVILSKNLSKAQPMNLQAAMLQYSRRYRLLKPGDRVLAAVSGGIDSMVMLYLLHSAGVHVTAAHCNFGLRGDESNLDEAFVKAEAEKSGIQCRAERFNTSAYATQKGLSIQMAARELRYRWFHELSIREDFDAIAIAHNRDDRIETLLINLARGTGIHGLSGIRQQNGKIIRPLLFASRKEIETYANTHGVIFREDSSNTTDKYARNYIRHHVIPGLEQYFPGIRRALDRNMEHFADVELFYNEAIEHYKSKIVTTRDDLVYINLQGLTQSPSSPALLYEILKPYGFSNTIAAEILEVSHYPSGRQFFSDTHRVVYDRQSLVLQKLDGQQPQKYMIDETASYLDAPTRLEIDKFERSAGYMPDTSPDTACLDGSKLQYPLLLRKWEHGDMFRPLGMKNMKKLSDFFIDTKLSLIEKERCWVLLSGGQIAWVAGLRIDDRFKITNETTHVVKITMKR
jgi:tRNA(Ile)-lysidine synthase